MSTDNTVALAGSYFMSVLGDLAVSMCRGCPQEPTKLPQMFGHFSVIFSGHIGILC